MNINEKILRGGELSPNDLPALASYRQQNFKFEVDFGLSTLPTEPGLIVVRGPRQYGKSTWLETMVSATYDSQGQASCFYLNGDDLIDSRDLFQRCEALVSQLNPHKLRHIFIDEITSVENWQLALKRLWDMGLTKDTLIVTTGSHAEDLISGAERLPGRKGKLSRTQFIFTPLSYKSFCEHSSVEDPENWIKYLLSGGSPVAASSLLKEGLIEPYVIEIVRDWILGAIAKSGRARSRALSLLSQLSLRGASPISLAKAARESGLANNSLAASYIDVFVSALFLHQSQPYDLQKQRWIPRKESKFPFINLLGAIAFQSDRVFSVDSFKAMPPSRQGVFLEWLVAQELWRREMRQGRELEGALPYLCHGKHEIDFLSNGEAYEVKLGSASPEEFFWFHKAFPKTFLTVICNTPFETKWSRGVKIQDFLLETEVNR